MWKKYKNFKKYCWTQGSHSSDYEEYDILDNTMQFGGS
jgi:hypothetical protein